MLSLKLDRCVPIGYSNGDEYHARSPSLFILYAVHACIGVFKTCVRFVNLLSEFVGVCD